MIKILPLVFALATCAVAQDRMPDKRQFLDDTVDLQLREGLKDRLQNRGDQQLMPQTRDWDVFKETRPYMPYKNLRSKDPMPMMEIDDSTQYTLRIKEYPNYAEPSVIDRGRRHLPND